MWLLWLILYHGSGVLKGIEEKDVAKIYVLV